METRKLADNVFTPADERLFRAQAIASQYSESTRKQWLTAVDLKRYLGAAESAYYRRALAYSIYVQEEMERCGEAKAHFAVGLLSMSLMELLLVMRFLGRKEEVLSTNTYRKECQRYRKAKKRTPPFLKIISTMKAEALYQLTREMEVIKISDISADCLDFIKDAHYPADVAGLLKYLQDSRNNVHFTNFAGRIGRMVPDYAVDPRNPLNDYHYGFAFVAIRVRNLISNQSDGSEGRNLLVRPF